MAIDFTLVIDTRHQFGPSDTNNGTWVGNAEEFGFDCPGRDASSQAILLFQSYSVGAQQVLRVNGVAVWGGVPTTDDFSLVMSPPVPTVNDQHRHSLPGGDQTGTPIFSSSDSHRHDVWISSFGWTGNVLLIAAGALTDSGNVLRVESSGDNFVIDNVVVVYKLEPPRPRIFWRFRGG